jgi:heme a synthase
MALISYNPVPRWLHAWALFTVAVSAAAVTLGAVVTTFRVGMADPVWPTYPWHLLLISWDEPSPGFLVEHAHRLVAYLAGFCVIVLAVGLWFGGSRRLGLLGLACVVVQGLLGGVRVLFNAKAGPELAAVHGCFAQVVFSLIVLLAVLTASGRIVELPTAEFARRCRRAALMLTALVLLQLVWGALVRHTHGAVAQRVHILTAFAVTAAVVWLVKTAWEQPAGRSLLGLPLIVVSALLVVQVCLGIEAWMGQYTTDLPPEAQMVTMGQAVVRTAHVVIGACILAGASIAAVQAHRATVAISPVVQEIVNDGYGPATSQQVKGTA